MFKKINFKNIIIVVIFSLIAIIGIQAHDVFSQITSRVFNADGIGFQLGRTDADFSSANKNLLWGLVKSTSNAGYFIKLQKGIGIDTFLVDIYGSITKANDIRPNQLCISGDCKSNWSELGGGSGNVILNQKVVTQSANFWISGAGNVQSLSVTPGGVESVQVRTNGASSFVVRDATDENDVVNISETGDVAGTYTVQGKNIGTGLTNISVNAGKGVTNVGLDANYLEGNDWNNFTTYVANNAIPSNPERHYFITSATTNGGVGGYSGLDAFCNSDINASSGRQYHVHGTEESGRDFKPGILYSNKIYGTFERVDPDGVEICRLHGVSCDTNWLADSHPQVTDTKVVQCQNWTSSSGALRVRYYRALNSADLAGVVNANVNTGGSCSWNNFLLCIEKSGPINDPSAVCGDGVINGNEYCDDGNTVDDATCPSDCSGDGGFCGDGFNATDETCEYNEIVAGSSLNARNRCNGSCQWVADDDGDGFGGQTDCWNRITNNDDDAYPGSTIESTTRKDMNCDGTISSRSACSGTHRPFAYSEPVCISQTQTAAQWCIATYGSGYAVDWELCFAPYYEVGCIKCTASTSYYW